MKTALLFDLDGTLLNTLEDLLDATNYALSQFGFPPRTLAELRRFVGNGAENQIRCSLPEGASPETVQAVLNCYKPYYTAHCQIKTAPYEGVLEQLSKLSYPMAIVSNKPDAAVKELCSRYFPGIPALGEQPGLPRKPHPAMVHRAMEALGASQCLYIGDSEVDIQTAKNAGAKSLAVLWGFRDREDLDGADGYCEAVSDLAAAIERMI